MEKCIYSFIESIKFYILENNMTSTSFSKAVGVLDTSVARWISGEIMPSLESVIKVANYLNCSIDYLFNLTDNLVLSSPSMEQHTFTDRFALLFSESKSSKAAVARACGIDSSAVAKWLYRGQFPKPSIVYHLAEYFACSIDYLVGRSNYR